MKNDLVKNFIIVGGMKCGSTSLHHFLGQQKDIFMPQKETHYFNNKDLDRISYQDYMAHLLKGEKGSEYSWVGDDTPTYSFDPSVPEKIKNCLDDVKFFWCLRDPFDRALSNYWHAVRSGVEHRSLEVAFRDELEGKVSNIWLCYISRSIYSEQINRYFELFDKSNFCFINFEEIKRSSQDAISRIEHFLDIKCKGQIPHSNATPHYPSPDFNKILRRVPSSRVRRAISIFRGKLEGDNENKNKFTSLSADIKSEVQSILYRDYEITNNIISKG